MDDKLTLALQNLINEPHLNLTCPQQVTKLKALINNTPIRTVFGHSVSARMEAALTIAGKRLKQPLTTAQRQVIEDLIKSLPCQPPPPFEG